MLTNHSEILSVYYTKLVIKAMSTLGSQLSHHPYTHFTLSNVTGTSKQEHAPQPSLCIQLK